MAVVEALVVDHDMAHQDGSPVASVWVQVVHGSYQLAHARERLQCI